VGEQVVGLELLIVKLLVLRHTGCNKFAQFNERRPQLRLVSSLELPHLLPLVVEEELRD
jgi:hypothetical protein